MKAFMDDDFLLTNETARKLYHDYAKDMPIIDYHCHLSPKEIYEDKKFRNLAEVWLGPGDRTGDHYKWRALRARGYSEDTISGNSDDYQKYYQYAESMPYFVGNPMYHWSHLEMRRYFDIYDIINSKNAKNIWDKANEKLNTLTARKMIEKFNVEVICTTDDPIDSLEYHKKMKDDKALKTKVLPTFRPDKILNIEAKGFIDYLNKLGSITNSKLTSIEEIKKALIVRMNYFNEAGCKLSDCSLEIVYYKEAKEDDAQKVLDKVLNSIPITCDDLDIYKGHMLVFLMSEFKKRNWACQLHVGALRNNSKLAFETLGPDTGFDGMADNNYIEKLSKILSELDTKNGLPKTILYNLNPKDNYSLNVLAGCFQKEGIKGYVQVGTAWWFLDQKDGISKNLETNMQISLVSNAVGMLTDSRSFLAYPRHEYYRRILCNKLGELVENGEYPIDEIDTLGSIVKDICYNNAKKYFEF